MRKTGLSRTSHRRRSCKLVEFAICTGSTSCLNPLKKSPKVLSTPIKTPTSSSTATKLSLVCLKAQPWSKLAVLSFRVSWPSPPLKGARSTKHQSKYSMHLLSRTTIISTSSTGQLRTCWQLGWPQASISGMHPIQRSRSCAI